MTLQEQLEAAQHEAFNLRAENESLRSGVRERDRIIDCEDDRVNKLIKEIDGLNAQLAAAEGRCEKAEAFKAWVHQYLDSHGVPHHPPGIHGAEGCRIGDRMDWLMSHIAQLAAAPKAVGDDVVERVARAMHDDVYLAKRYTWDSHCGPDFKDFWRRQACTAIAAYEASRAKEMIPQFLCQEYTGKWHAFEDRRDGEHFGRVNDLGYSRQSVSEWIWHPATRTEDAADGNIA